VGGADAEVVHAAGAAEAHFAEGVEAVVAEPVVAGFVGSGGLGLGQGCVGGGGGPAAEFAVGSVVVVEVAEAVEVVLEGGQGGCRFLLGEPFLEGLVEPFDLALGLGVAGVAILLGDPQEREEVFEGVLAAAEAGRVDAAVEFLTDVKRRRRA